MTNTELSELQTKVTKMENIINILLEKGHESNEMLRKELRAKH